MIVTRKPGVNGGANRPYYMLPNGNDFDAAVVRVAVQAYENEMGQNNNGGKWGIDQNMENKPAAHGAVRKAQEELKKAKLGQNLVRIKKAHMALAEVSEQRLKQLIKIVKKEALEMREAGTMMAKSDARLQRRYYAARSVMGKEQVAPPLGLIKSLHRKSKRTGGDPETHQIAVASQSALADIRKTIKRQTAAEAGRNENAAQMARNLLPETQRKADDLMLLEEEFLKASALLAKAERGTNAEKIANARNLEKAYMNAMIALRKENGVDDALKNGLKIGKKKTPQLRIRKSIDELKRLIFSAKLSEDRAVRKRKTDIELLKKPIASLKDYSMNDGKSAVNADLRAFNRAFGPVYNLMKQRWLAIQEAKALPKGKERDAAMERAKAMGKTKIMAARRKLLAKRPVNGGLDSAPLPTRAPLVNGVTTPQSHGNNATRVARVNGVQSHSPAQHSNFKPRNNRMVHHHAKNAKIVSRKKKITNLEANLAAAMKWRYEADEMKAVRAERRAAVRAGRAASGAPGLLTFVNRAGTSAMHANMPPAKKMKRTIKYDDE